MPATRTICRRLNSAEPSWPMKSCCSTSGARRQDTGAVFADITWVAVTSTRVPAEVSRAFQAVADARDAAVRLVADAASDGRDLRGWEVDEAARAVLNGAGLRRPDRASHRSQPRGNRARKWRPHGRLRNARRSAAPPRHRFYGRTGPLFRNTSASAPRSTCIGANTRQL